MKILIISRLNKTPEEEANVANAIETLKALASGDGGIEVQRDEELDWEHIRAVTGSFNGAYRHVAQAYDRIVVNEGPGRTMAKGQTSIVEEALAVGTPVVAWRNGKGVKVEGVERIAGGSWKNGYARVVL